MILTLENELLLAPHTLKATVSTDEIEPEAETSNVPQCQICFDACDEDAATTAMKAVKTFCGPNCPAVVCRGCIAEHVRVSVEAAFPGVMPKVRCPICLERVNKAAWESFANDPTVTKYVRACATACSFQTPCCHNPEYTHLPCTTNFPSKYIKLKPLKLSSTLEPQLAALHAETQRFCNFEISSKELIIFIEDTFGRHVDLDTQLLILEHELLRIDDEERRATLLLSYHAKYKVVTTRCCGTKTCFNCKRNMSSHTKEGACDTGEIAEASIVECRSCHVTMVKSEGCSAVRCWCGFGMNWDYEVRLRDTNKKQLIPVDIFDISTHDAWEKCKRILLPIVQNELLPLRLALRLSRIDQQLLDIDGLRTTLRKIYHGQYLWRRRFKRALPKIKTEMVRVRMLLLAKRLKTHPSFLEAVRRAKWRLYWKRMVKSTKMQREFVRVRMQILARRLKRYEVFVESVRRWKWRRTWKRTVKSPSMRRELTRVRMRLLAKRLKRCDAFVIAVGRATWRRRFTRALPKLTKELADCRVRRCAKKLTQRRPFVEAVHRAKWRTYWKRVVKSVHAKQFWISYMSEHRDEQRELRDVEMAMLLPQF